MPGSRRVAMLVPSTQEGDVGAAGSRGGPAALPLVWLLEDSALHACHLQAALGDLHRVEHFADGAALLERLATGEAPDVLVLDWELPGLAGIEVCRFVRQSRDELTLPILMHTGARKDPQDLLDALAAGVNDFVPKPCAPAEFRARVTTLVRVRQLFARSQQADRERQEALAALEREAVVRERYVAILGHDLRAPLAAILMSAPLLRLDLPEASPAADVVGIVERGARRMERMIADLLDLARSRSAEGMPIVRAATDLRALCRRVLDEVAAGDPRREVCFTAEPDALGSWDADRVEQVVSNLVSNALAYRVPGTPVRVALRGEAASVTFEVVNQGTIPPESIAGLFDPFRRGAAPGGRPASGGLGLGLYIVHSIVRAHGGTVTAASEDGVTTLRVTLPRGG